MLHPAIAHFAVVLPIVSLVISISYLVKPSELMSKISTRFMVFASLFLIFAFFSGKNDGAEAYPFLSSEGQAALIQHKDLGLYLAIGMFIASVVKFYGCFKQSLKAEIFSILLVAILSAGILFQAKMGGELTYMYGANVEKYSDGMDCLEDPTDFLEEE